MPKDMATLPSEFLLAVVDRAVQREHYRSMNNEWCDYHEHDSDTEHDSCEERRKQDPDVLWKNGRAQASRKCAPTAQWEVYSLGPSE